MLTPAEIREHINTDESDAALQRIINAETAAMVRIAGPLDGRVEQFHYHDYGDRYLIPDRPIESITSVVEDDELLVEGDDYELQESGHWIKRLNRSWGADVTVSYVPVDQSEERIRVLIQLVKLYLAQSGYRTQRNPDFTLAPLEYQQERVRTLRQLKRMSFA